ncbi:MAG: hypothetical protein JSS07_09300 [Proteobacteria bacterium]|nr:hypothetical protein [Pseudomonadota bacterium]
MDNRMVHEGILLDETITYTLKEITFLSDIDETIIIEMVEYGIAEPLGSTHEKWVFNSQALLRLKKAMRLHRDLHINWPGISLALDLMQERDELRTLLKIMQKNNE